MVWLTLWLAAKGRGHGPGLVEPFFSQIWISVRGWRQIQGIDSYALDLGSEIDEGGGGVMVFGARQWENCKVNNEQAVQVKSEAGCFSIEKLTSTGLLRSSKTGQCWSTRRRRSSSSSSVASL